MNNARLFYYMAIPLNKDYLIKQSSQNVTTNRGGVNFITTNTLTCHTNHSNHLHFSRVILQLNCTFNGFYSLQPTIFIGKTQDSLQYSYLQEGNDEICLYCRALLSRRLAG